MTSGDFTLFIQWAAFVGGGSSDAEKYAFGIKSFAHGTMMGSWNPSVKGVIVEGRRF